MTVDRPQSDDVAASEAYRYPSSSNSDLIGPPHFITCYEKYPYLFQQQGASSIPDRLMDVRIPVVEYWKCVLSYATVLTDNMFCAGNFFLGGQGTCQGDSGGAAVQDGQAVGIVSFGRGCGQPLSPSVFADIAAPEIRDFITKHTGL
ncbi:Trypsin-2 [Eumeta japonica]|uniref:Trypsin-2 n=1 Tax=Eumeta variegata TaxID=151549 RepID=A0A4C1YV33_EUMVA|nr:Trypsin-2 [Eumeta japonica]